MPDTLELVGYTVAPDRRHEHLALRPERSRRCVIASTASSTRDSPRATTERSSTSSAGGEAVLVEQDAHLACAFVVACRLRAGVRRAYLLGEALGLVRLGELHRASGRAAGADRAMAAARIAAPTLLA